MNDKQLAWLTIYAGIVSLQHHPKNEGAQVNYADLAARADDAFQQYERRLTWLGSQPEQQ